MTTFAAASLTCSFLTPTPVFAFTESSTDVNLAQNAVNQTSVTGVADSKFTNMEATYPGSLLGTDSWHGFCRQGGRDIIVVLPQTSSIDSISLQFEQDAGSGVFYPSSVQFDVAQNGSWMSLGASYSGIPLTDKRTTVHTFQVHLNHISGQVLRIHFPVGVWVFARGLKVMGTPTGTGYSDPSIPPLGQPRMNSAMSPNDARAAGIRNMLLVYTYGYGAQGTWSPGDFLPMISYQQQSASTESSGSALSNTTGQQSAVGTAAGGRMFDTMLFLPYGTVPSTQAGWTSYVQDLFSQNQQLSALDAAVAAADEEMGTPSYQENVVLSIPYVPYGTNDFGQVNGQTINFGGSATDPNGVSARETAMNWELQTLMDDWRQANLEHLHLTGIYFDYETISDSDPGAKSVLTQTIGKVHQYGLPLFWIPFYGADHSQDWQQLGFDAAWLQPNFVEQGTSADITRIRNSETEATDYGMGIELELNGFDQTNETLYEESLQQFAADGFGSRVSHAFYDGSKMLVYAANSADPTTRALYDDTYTFINNQN